MTPQLEGAVLLPITPLEASEAVDWLLAASPRPQSVPEELQWAVVQAADAFVWGVRTDEAWRWATQHADREARPLRREALLEVRAFFSGAELLLWRTGAAFAGRILCDVSGEAPGGSPSPTALSPLDRRCFFLPVPNEDGALSGRVLTTPDPGFLRREEGNGRTTVTPLGTGILFRNYLEQCQETGMLRVAATRFHSIF